MPTIRPASRSDLGNIVLLIRELAEYEKLAHEVVLDEAAMGEHLFGAHPCIEVLIAEVEEEVVGFALFFPNYSTFQGKPGIHLEDLFVRPEHRAKGIGKALLLQLARIAVERDCGRLEWTVLDWNEPSINFYKSLGAIPMDEWTVFRVAGEKLTRLAGVPSFHLSK